MRIVFLGTSHGIPQPGRKCSCALVEVSGQICLIDMGIIVMEELVARSIAPERIRAVLLTHMHGDHVNGLPAFLDHISWAWSSADPEIFLPEPELAPWLEAWVTHTSGKTRSFSWRGVEAGVILDDGTLRVTAFQNKHTRRSFSFLLEAEGKAVLFTGDLKNPEKDFPPPETGIKPDLIVGEASHFPAGAYEEPCRRCGTGTLCLTHCSPKKLPEILQLAKSDFPARIILAEDGMELTL